MPFNQEEIEKLANLARLSLPTTDKSIADDLDKILELVNKIVEQDTTNVEPMAHPLDNAQRLRDDLVTEPSENAIRDKLQKIIDDQFQQNGLYLVPRVVE